MKYPILAYLTAMLLLMSTGNLSIAQEADSATVHYKQTHEYQCALLKFNTSYNKALYVMFEAGEDLTDEEIIKRDAEYDALMKEAYVHFNQLVRLTPDGKEKDTMIQMLACIDSTE